MLYKQAWQELKAWAKEKEMLLYQRKMNELEKRWKIIPEKKNPGNWGQGAPYIRKENKCT